MLNRDKVILMTKMAEFEQHEGKADIRMNGYYRDDYVSSKVLKSFICFVMVLVICFALYMICGFEGAINSLYSTDIVGLLREILVWVCILTGIYTFIAYLVYSYRYTKMRKKLKIYYSNLKKLNNMYDENDLNH